MKKKIILMLVLIASFVCLLVITSSAASLSNFVDVKLTLTDGTETTGYMAKGSQWNGYQGYDRVTIYTDYADTSSTIAWENIEIFDMRESQIYTYDQTNGKVATGAYPQTLLGHPTNPVNVTHVYYPQGSVIIADTSFPKEKGWQVEYIWIPKSVKIIGKNAFNNSTTLTTVELEEGSQLENIQYYSFSGCSNLSSFEFPESLTTVGECAFYQSGISGKVVLPNAVTSVGDGAFRTTKVEALVFGDGEISIGYNVVGNDSTNNEYLKEIFVPIEATFKSTHLSQIWFGSQNTISFYVIADEGEDCSTFIETLKGTGRVTFATQKEIDAGTATSGYNAVIIEGYNKCKAFYNDTHAEDDDKLCTTDNYCSNCNVLMTEKLSEHDLKVTITYPNGYDKSGNKASVCQNSGCDYGDGKAESVDAIFDAVGYSTNDAQNALTGGFTVNHDAYDAYNGIAKFGIIIVNAKSFDEGEEFLNNGILNSEYGVQVEMTDTQYSVFNCSINDFDEARKSSLELIITLYIIDNDGNITYVQSESAYANTSDVGTKSFDSVNLSLVISNLPASATVAEGVSSGKEE